MLQQLLRNCGPLFVRSLLAVNAIVFLFPVSIYAQELANAKYVGVDVCAECHVQQVKLWQGSHHDLAMQDANDDTVLADFSSTKFTYAGITSTFYKKNDKYMVRTDGPDGKLHDYEIKYAFGITPLQQYLVELEKVDCRR